MQPESRTTFNGCLGGFIEGVSSEGAYVKLTQVRKGNRGSRGQKCN